MHLQELPYYRAMAYERLGESLCARSMITKYRRIWSQIDGVADNGFFAATLFFISFVDAPQNLRRSKFLYLTALCDRFERSATAEDKLRDMH